MCIFPLIYCHTPSQLVQAGACVSNLKPLKPNSCLASSSSFPLPITWHGEYVLDISAGIGFYVLPLLVHAGAISPILTLITDPPFRISSLIPYFMVPLPFLVEVNAIDSKPYSLLRTPLSLFQPASNDGKVSRAI
jgi:hypothetical protein